MFLQRRYKAAEAWEDGGGRAFSPGVHDVVGGDTKVYGASLPRFRESDLEEVAHLEGVSHAPYVAGLAARLRSAGVHPGCGCSGW